MQNDIIFGIHHAVNEAAGLDKEELVDNDFLVSEVNVNYTLERNGSEFHFKDYYSVVFHKIRHLLGCSPEEFLSSWTIEEDSKMEVSTARSGSLFYKTGDGNFLFKTILHPEVAAMEALIKDYYYHLVNEPNTFIVRIYGLFRISYSSILDKQTWVLVMGNSLPPGIKMDEVFDLKGRTPKKGKGPTEREPVSRGARKDNEILRKIIFWPNAKEFFITQLEKDVELLKKHNIMDYSLLVGIHTLTPEEKAIFPLIEQDVSKKKKKKKNTKPKDNVEIDIEKIANHPDARVFQFDGLMARHPETGDDEMIFLGIIDNLTLFNGKKMVANFCKSFLWDEATLSTVGAEFYAKRFLDWMTKSLMGDGEIDLRSEEIIFEEYAQRISSGIKSKRSLTNVETGNDGESKATIERATSKKSKKSNTTDTNDSPKTQKKSKKTDGDTPPDSSNTPKTPKKSKKTDGGTPPETSSNTTAPTEKSSSKKVKKMNSTDTNHSNTTSPADSPTVERSSSKKVKSNSNVASNNSTVNLARSPSEKSSSKKIKKAVSTDTNNDLPKTTETKSNKSNTTTTPDTEPTLERASSGKKKNKDNVERAESKLKRSGPDPDSEKPASKKSSKHPKTTTEEEVKEEKNVSSPRTGSKKSKTK